MIDPTAPNSSGPCWARDPERLVRLIARDEVTRLLCVPSLYDFLLDAAERASVGALRSLDTVIVAGEPLPQTLVDRHFDVHPGGVALVNEYGPTETTVWASYRRFDAPARVSIGGPVPGVQLYVLDDHLVPVPPGVEGELFIGGVGVSRGYFGRPEATARAFRPDPFAAADTAGARMYRTGDRVRWNAEGTLDFIGRHDDQVKVRGHRVELGAVEEALRALPGVRDATVVPNAARTQLIGFVVGDHGVTAEPLRAALADRLVAAMVPARIHRLDQLPRTINGKVDRAALALAAEDTGRPEPHPSLVDSAGGMTARVVAAWAEVLKTTHVPIDVNFFDLGGHSLTMFALQDALEQHTGSRPSVVALFRHTTVSAQAALIRDGVPGPTEPAAEGRLARRTHAVRARRQRAEQEVTT